MQSYFFHFKKPRDSPGFVAIQTHQGSKLLICLCFAWHASMLKITSCYRMAAEAPAFVSYLLAIERRMRIISLLGQLPLRSHPSSSTQTFAYVLLSII